MISIPHEMTQALDIGSQVIQWALMSGVYCIRAFTV
jgi:hypothetical protein